MMVYAFLIIHYSIILTRNYRNYYNIIHILQKYKYEHLIHNGISK